MCFLRPSFLPVRALTLLAVLLIVVVPNAAGHATIFDASLDASEEVNFSIHQGGPPRRLAHRQSPRFRPETHAAVQRTHTASAFSTGKTAKRSRRKLERGNSLESKEEKEEENEEKMEDEEDEDSEERIASSTRRRRSSSRRRAAQPSSSADTHEVLHSPIGLGHSFQQRLNLLLASTSTFSPLVSMSSLARPSILSAPSALPVSTRAGVRKSDNEGVNDGKSEGTNESSTEGVVAAAASRLGRRLARLWGRAGASRSISNSRSSSGSVSGVVSGSVSRIVSRVSGGGGGVGRKGANRSLKTAVRAVAGKAPAKAPAKVTSSKSGTSTVKAGARIGRAPPPPPGPNPSPSDPYDGLTLEQYEENILKNGGVDDTAPTDPTPAAGSGTESGSGEEEDKADGDGSTNTAGAGAGAGDAPPAAGDGDGASGTDGGSAGGPALGVSLPTVAQLNKAAAIKAEKAYQQQQLDEMTAKAKYGEVDKNFKKQFVRSKLATGSALTSTCNKRCAAKVECNTRCQLGRNRYQLSLAKTTFKKNNVVKYAGVTETIGNKTVVVKGNSRFYQGEVASGNCNARCVASKTRYQKARVDYMKTFHEPCQNGHIKNSQVSYTGRTGLGPYQVSTASGAGRGRQQVNWPNSAKYNWRTQCKSYENQGTPSSNHGKQASWKQEGTGEGATTTTKAGVGAAGGASAGGAASGAGDVDKSDKSDTAGDGDAPPPDADAGDTAGAAGAADTGAAESGSESGSDSGSDAPPPTADDHDSGPAPVYATDEGTGDDKSSSSSSDGGTATDADTGAADAGTTGTSATDGATDTGATNGDTGDVAGGGVTSVVGDGSDGSSSSSGSTSSSSSSSSSGSGSSSKRRRSRSLRGKMGNL